MEEKGLAEQRQGDPLAERERGLTAHIKVDMRVTAQSWETHGSTKRLFRLNQQDETCAWAMIKERVSDISGHSNSG